MYLYRKFRFCYATERAIWSSNRWTHRPLMRTSNNICWKRIKILSDRSCDEICMRGKACLCCVVRHNFRTWHGFAYISLQNHWIFYRKPLSTIVDLVDFLNSHLDTQHRQALPRMQISSQDRSDRIFMCFQQLWLLARIHRRWFQRFDDQIACSVA